MMRTATRRKILHVTAFLAAATAVYALLGFFAIPYFLQREVEAYAQRSGLDISIGELRTNPFLLTLDAHQLRVAEPGANAVLAAPLLHLDLRWASLWERGLRADRAILQSPRMRLVLDPGGLPSSPGEAEGPTGAGTTKGHPAEASVAQHGATTNGDTPEQADGGAPTVLIEKLRLNDARIALAGGIVPRDKPLDLGPIDLVVQGLSTAQGESAAFQMTAGLLQDARLAAEGTIGVNPLRTAGTVEMRDLQLAAVLPLVMHSDAMAAPSGDLALDFRYAVSRDSGSWAVRLNALSAQLNDLHVPQPGAGGPLLALDRVSLRGVDLDTTAANLLIAEAAMHDGVVTAVRGAEGDWNFSLLERVFTGPDEAPERREKRWQVRLGALGLESIGVHMVDRSLPQPIEARVRSLDAQASLALRFGEPGVEGRAEDVGVVLAGISAVAAGDQESVATLARLELQGGVADTASRRVVVQRFTLAEGAIALARDQQGTLLLSGEPPASQARDDAAADPAARDGATASKRSATAPEEPSPAAAVETFAVGNEPALLRVAAQPAPSRRSETQADDAQAVDKNGEGTGSGAWQIVADTMQIEDLALRYVDRALALPLRFAVGSLDARMGVDVRIAAASKQAVQAQLSGVAVDAAGVRAELGEKPAPLEVATLALRGAMLNTQNQRFEAESLLLAQTDLDVVHTETGVVRLLGIDWSLLDTGDDATGPSPIAGWAYGIERVRLRDIGLDLADRNFSPPIDYALMLDASFTNVATGATEPIAFEATLQAEQGGALQATGTLAQDLGQARAQLSLEQFALAPLEPLLARYAALEIVSGTASADMTIEYAGGAEKQGSPSLRATGTLGARSVQIVETATDRSFAAWESLAAEGVDLGISPDRLEIAEVRLVGPQAQLVVSEKRTLNFTRVLRDDYRDDAGKQSTTESAPSAEAFPIRIGRVSVSEGTLEFADLSLVLPFATRVHEVSGVVVGISTAAGAHAELQFDGEIADYGSARASGRLNTFDPTQFMDITAEFDNLLMPPFSPYTATFAGRTIESGRLWLELEYRIKDDQLSGVNEIVAQNLQLGKRVENQDAADLPLELGLALLTDAKGRVRLRIPVSGNVGDPQFEYAHLIRDAIAGAFRKVVSAPFRALAALFGGRDADVVRSVVFDPGSDVLPAAERKELEAIAAALQARPALELVVYGPYDPVIDAQALRADALRRTIAQRLGRTVPPDQAADPVAFTDPRTQRALDALLRARLGEQDYAAFRHAIEASGRPFYQAAFEQLASRIELPESRLKTLAAQRAQAITERLAAAGVERARIATPGIRTVDAEKASDIVATLDLRARSGAS